MARAILSEYGPDSADNQQPRATNGGKMDVKSISYSAPKGPSNVNDPKSPGLHGTNHGCGTNRKG